MSSKTEIVLQTLKTLLEAGCTAYLSKPVRRRALVAAMQGLLGRRDG